MLTEPALKTKAGTKLTIISTHVKYMYVVHNRHFSLLNVNAAGACGYDFPCDGGRLVRAYLRRRRGTI